MHLLRRTSVTSHAERRVPVREPARSVRPAGSEAVVPAGRLLIERGHAASGLYTVLEGSVLVEAPEGTYELGPGSILGERALATPNGRRTARVRALTDVRVLALNRIDVEQLDR